VVYFSDHIKQFKLSALKKLLAMHSIDVISKKSPSGCSRFSQVLSKFLGKFILLYKYKKVKHEALYEQEMWYFKYLFVIWESLEIFSSIMNNFFKEFLRGSPLNLQERRI